METPEEKVTRIEAEIKAAQEAAKNSETKLAELVKSTEAKEAENAVSILGGKIEECIKFQLPESEIGRSFVKIRKSKSTPKKYPRKAGIPAKEPL